MTMINLKPQSPQASLTDASVHSSDSTINKPPYPLQLSCNLITSTSPFFKTRHPYTTPQIGASSKPPCCALSHSRHDSPALMTMVKHIVLCCDPSLSARVVRMHTLEEVAF